QHAPSGEVAAREEERERHTDQAGAHDAGERQPDAVPDRLHLGTAVEKAAVVFERDARFTAKDVEYDEQVRIEDGPQQEECDTGDEPEKTTRSLRAASFPAERRRCERRSRGGLFLRRDRHLSRERPRAGRRARVCDGRGTRTTAHAAGYRCARPARTRASCPRSAPRRRTSAPRSTSLLLRSGAPPRRRRAPSCLPCRRADTSRATPAAPSPAP